MNKCSPRNPNICLDCEALTFDDSPLMLPGQTEAPGFSEHCADDSPTSDVLLPDCGNLLGNRKEPTPQ